MSVVARLWALREERPVFVAVTAVVLAYFAVYPVIDWWLRSLATFTDVTPFGFNDFGVYMGTIERWFAGEPLYVRNADGSFHGSWLYPPIALLLFLPFEPLSFRAGAMAWGALSLGLLWVGLQLMASTMGLRLRWFERVGLLWLLLGFQPLLYTVKWAQTAGFLTALLCFAYVAMVRGREDRRWAYASGVLTAMVGAVKPTYGPVGAHLLADRRRLTGALAAGGVLAGASVLLFGVLVHQEYLAVIGWGIERDANTLHPAQLQHLWLPAYYRPLVGIGESFPIRVAIALAVATYAALSAPTAERQVFAMGLAAFPLVAPLTYTYYLTALVPAAIVMLAVEFDHDGYPTVPVVALFLASVHSYGLKLVVDFLPVSGALYSVVPFLQPGLWANLLLLGLAAFRVADHVSLPDRLRQRVGETA